ncbi:MAG: hypothetical protein ACKOV8_12070 [Phycisphaerales bacterium]
MTAIVALYAASVAYAIIRYVAFTPANAGNIPVFIVNKAVAMAAVLCLAVGFLAACRRMRGRPVRIDPATWFRAGIFGAVWHVPMALAILDPAYFKEFFAVPADPAAPPRLSTAGEVVFMFGGLAAATVFLLLRPHWTPRERWRLSLAASAVLLCHVLSMGWCRGVNMTAKHAYLPPMWLLSAIGIALGAWWLLRSRPADGGDGSPSQG